MAILLVAASVLLIATGAALAATGDLIQPAGTPGCISETGAETCADGHALRAANSVAVSPDGKSVYVGSGPAVVRFIRNPTTGALTQPPGIAGCISETGAGGCADGHGVDGAFDVAVSPDGKSVYAASGGAVARFIRNTTTGGLTQPPGRAGCISETGAGLCADGHGLHSVLGVTVSPDGKSVYVASGGREEDPGGVARLNRNTTTGAIGQPAGVAGCVTEMGTDMCADGHALSGALDLAVSPDGKSVYVASRASDAVARFNRNTTTGAIAQPPGAAGCVSETGAGPCADGRALDFASEVTVSSDGNSVYVASLVSSAVARFNRGAVAGGISQPPGTAGCLSQTGAQNCADGRALGGASGVAVSPDGKSVYVASTNSDAVVRLNRNTTTGDLTQPAAITGCVSQTGAGPCADGRALNFAMAVTVSPDGKSVYVASAGSGGTSGSQAVARFNRAP